jgi:hypothetical protein
MNTLQLLIEKYPDKPWDWRTLSSNPSITPEFIEKYSDKPWDWGINGLSRNPVITLEFIEKHIDKPWNWGIGGFLTNNFNFNYKNYKKQKNKLIKDAVFNELENWLWKPICNDSLLGINPRISIKELDLKK